MILYFGASCATRDIDVLVLRGDPAELRQGVKSVARERLVPLAFTFQNLCLYALGRPEQAAMKIVALRIHLTPLHRQDHLIAVNLMLLQVGSVGRGALS